MKKVAITGVNGFVGPYVVQEFLAHGYEVVGCGREAVFHPHLPVALANYAVVDVTDSKKIDEWLQQEQPTHIVHLAGIGSPVIAAANPELTEQIHVGGTRHLLTSASRLSTPPTVLVVSSSHVYGRPQYLPIDEKHPLLGEGAYAASRQAQEKVSVSFFEKVPIVIARSFNHTGPGQPADYVVPKIVKRVAEIAAGKQKELVMGNTDIRREFLHVRDVARAYRLLLEQGQFGIITNVCRGESIPLKKIIEYTTLLANLSDIPVRVDPALIRAGEPQDAVGDAAFLQMLIDWKPKYGYEELLKDMYTYWQKNI